MKHLLTLALMVIGLSSIAQTKPKTDTTKHYNYFVVIPAKDYQQLISIATDYKGLCIYDPKLPADVKIKIQQGIDSYLANLPQRLKVDSSLTDTLKKIKPSPKKK